ncbi:MAG: DUF4861 domain-containing protein [Bacteroidales bacterium]|nr:DUF4861 domain-containing protein [Bacteroidales bacterium]
MKKYLIVALALLAIACSQDKEPKVMARAVPERADDFVFENNLIAGRFYGKALEGNPTSPGIDIWVKLPGALVANDWYKNAVEGGDASYYHKDHGGKDCYKVAVSLGGGASVPYVGESLCYPATNYRSSEVLKESADELSFVLHYPEWQAGELKVSLDKKVTVYADSYFCKVEDSYNFDADSLTIAAGIFRHNEAETIEAEAFGEDYYAIWEKASDQSVEPEDGMIGVAVIMPGADCVTLVDGGRHGACLKKIARGETVEYWFGSCWSKGEIIGASVWFDLAANL